MKIFTDLEKNDVGCAVTVMARSEIESGLMEFRPYFLGTIWHKKEPVGPHWFPYGYMGNAVVFKDPKEFFDRVKEIREDIEKYEPLWEIDWSGTISFYTISVNHLVSFNDIKWDK